MIATGDSAGIAIAYRPTLLIDAIWQKLARKAAGIIRCARCPAPNCGRWFLRSSGRRDREYYSATCRTSERAATCATAGDRFRYAGPLRQHVRSVS